MLNVLYGIMHVEFKRTICSANRTKLYKINRLAGSIIILYIVVVVSDKWW